VTHAQTWASYSALYRFGRLAQGPSSVNKRLDGYIQIQQTKLQIAKYTFASITAPKQKATDTSETSTNQYRIVINDDRSIAV